MTVSTPVQQHIRILDAQGLSWRRIAREVGVSRQTVRKYAELEDRSPKPPGHAKAKSKPDPFKPVIDKWLQADRMMPRKQRHSAMRIWRRLRDERGYDGSYQLVQHHVRQRKRDWREPGDGFMELEWEPGVMQVDFGRALAVIGGERTDVHCLVATFPYPNMRHVVALPGENAECVCEGLETVFSHVGPAPRVMVFDNATGAAHRVAWDRITIVDVFQRFVERYRVEVRFCNPGSGWEKGGVENAVGFAGRNLMVPMPSAESFRASARVWLDACERIAGSDHCRHGVPVRELFEAGKDHMPPLARRRVRPVWLEGREGRQDRLRRHRREPVSGRPEMAFDAFAGRGARLRDRASRSRWRAHRHVGTRVGGIGEDPDGPGEPARDHRAQAAHVGRKPDCVLASWRPLCERCFSAV